jgi:hypothetical protein
MNILYRIMPVLLSTFLLPSLALPQTAVATPFQTRRQRTVSSRNDEVYSGQAERGASH